MTNLFGDEEPTPASPRPVAPAAPRSLSPDQHLAIVWAVDLAKRGHKLLRNGDKIVVTYASTLSEIDRAALREVKPLLLPFLPAMPAVRAEAPLLVQFLSPDRPELPNGWRAPEPPDLTGIHEIVYNLATRDTDWTKGPQVIGRTICTMDRQKTWFLPSAFSGSGNIDPATMSRWEHEQLRDKKIHGSKIKFDIHHARENGTDLEAQNCRFTDIQHTAALLFGDSRYVFGIDALAKDFLGGIRVGRLDESRHWQYTPSEAVAREEYTAQLVPELHDKFYPMLDEQDLRRVQDLEDDFIPAGVEMEKNGVLIDEALTLQYKAECRQKYEAIVMGMFPEIGFLFDGSKKSWKRLFERYKIPITYSKSKNGKPAQATFKEDIIDGIDHPMIKQAYFAKQILDLSSKTFTPYSNLVDSYGVLRYELNQLKSDEGGTVSGRTSAGYVQQVPNQYNHFDVFGEMWNPKRCFISPSNMLFFEADAAQIEFRLWSHFANNPTILAEYAKNPEVSFHKMIHAMLLPYKANMNYVALKSLNFATMYSAGLIKTAVMMKFITAMIGEEIKTAGTEKTDPRLAQAREIKEIYQRLLPESDAMLKAFSHEAQSACNDWCNKSKASRELHARFTAEENYGHKGYVSTILGRRSRFPNDYGLHRGLNRVLQGSGADILKRKIIDLHNMRKQTGFLMRCTVHDSVFGDIPDAESAAMVKKVLNEQTYHLRVPILWSTGTSTTNWADVKE